MHKGSATLLLFGPALVAGALCCSPTHARTPDTQAFAQVERGRYLVTAADCAACHTRPDGGAPFAGGRSIETPFGNVVSANITPDRESGIGAWTDDEFDNAVRKGIRPDGSRLYPAMPYTSYTKMTRDDVKAMHAYLSSIAPVHNVVHSDTLPFPFSIRSGMQVWDWLFFKSGTFQPDHTKSAEWNRVKYLKTGHNAISGATGPMSEEIAVASSHMSDNDLQAIATYLKSIPGRNDQDKPVAKDDPQMKAGSAIYRDQCSACHGLDGKGVANLFPSLANSSQARSDDPSTLLRVILRGARSAATDPEPTGPGMPSFAWQLNDDEIAAVATYIRNAWGSTAPAVSADTVENSRKSLAKRTE